MPPKKARHDWTWVSEVDDASAITDDHRLRAAGLKDLVDCPYVFSLDKHDLPPKSKTCTSKRCESNPACVNHVGVTSLLDRKKGKEQYLEDRLPPLQARRWKTRDLNGSAGGLRDGLMGGDEAGIDSSPVSSSSKVTLGRMPAGLRNLGATCYANAFLQLWFYNVAFRNAIYACSPVPGSPLFHLAHIFASLQHSPKQYVDPTGLIEALRLDKSDQQDAGEFSKLFLDLIAGELSKQKDPSLRRFTRDLFEGQKEITITCDCGYRSPRTEEFLELEIPLKDGETLLDRLQFSLASERLEGTNQYHCPSCHSKRNAIRSTRLTSLPPVLNFTLVRFAYDLKAQERKKSKASINFPRLLELENHQYHLHAIIGHQGPNAHQGHFVCEALDEQAECWWLCNDEDVSRISRSVRSNSWHAGLNGNSSCETNGPPTKRAKHSSSMLSSRDAYMLVYSRTPPVTPVDPPSQNMAKVEEDTQRWETEMGDRERKKYILEEEYEAVTAAKRQVAAILPGHDRLLPSTELERWFAAGTVVNLFGPWSISTCSHGAIAPDTTADFKLVSQAAFDLLADYCEPGASELDAKPDDRSRSSSSSGPKPTTYSTLPQLNVCRECVSETYSEKTVLSIELTPDQRAAWMAEIKPDRTLVRKHLNPKSLVYKQDYYYLPTSFVDALIDYTRRPMADRPELDPNLGRCEHGLLDVDLELDQAHFVSSEGWYEIVQRYGEAVPITFQFNHFTELGKRYPKVNTSVPTCDPCRTRRLLDFEETQILLVMEKPASSRRQKGREAPLTVSKSTRIVDIKVEVMNESGLTPAFQVLYHNGRELDSQETIESAHILSGDTIICKEIVAEELKQDGAIEERGFGGTALRGRIVCPECTLENDSTAEMCEACNRPFGYD